MTLAARFDHHLASLALPAGPAVVAVSGGADSLALLDLLTRSAAARVLTLHVAHADHGIHPESARVADQVRAGAARYGLPIHVTRLALGGAASETAARSARYAWLEQLADELAAELIFTAHHQDDQVETILMRVLRGSGPAGLAGIAPRRGRLVRPLLPFRRAELAAHVHAVGLEAWQDPANADLRQERAWVRGELLPLLRSRLPAVERRILGLGRQAARQRTAWDTVLERLPDLDLQPSCEGVSVAASPLHGYDSSAREALLGALGRRVGCLIGPARAAQVERLLKGGRSGAVAELGNGCAAELSFGRLRLFRRPAHPLPWEPAVIAGDAGNLVAAGWRISWRQEPAPELLERNPAASWFTPGAYSVRPWRAGDRIRPLGASGRRLVVRCMQDARIARSRRASWPVIEAAGTIVWVPGACRSAERIPAAATPALRIDAHLA
ncbi:MAG TPA: tRNA lysidine(34) synthetase TilS [Gemmatimonadales bacterium]|jgi:tRNA(Ile)-lysidine synthase|nr:tRNA lysidine(34) synthetase TilS [Gemmatimonadales bacterium]